MKKIKQTTLYSSPYLVWSLIFVIFPLLIVLFFSFTQKTGDSYSFTLANFEKVFDITYMKVFGLSLYLAAISTILCLLIGYPLAYLVSKLGEKRRNLVITLMILPMWMNFLLRTYSWMAILGNNGIINTILTKIGLPKLNLLYNNGAVLLGMVYNFLPFMILPIYTVLIKMDKDLINAASDLGATRWQTFRKVILPLSIPGVASGITMVFMPAVTTFVISRLLGGGQYMLVGNLIEQQFTTMDDWHFGSALSIFMIIIILISMAIMGRYDKDSKEGGGNIC
ncbi:ABC transporter permease [Clostridium sp.]|uniref:ABC transporter permease n=1 Tax=Clostridium sp. TaxID=1506 RepID=UPI0034643E43